MLERTPSKLAYLPAEILKISYYFSKCIVLGSEMKIYCLRFLKCLIGFVLYQVLGKSWGEQRMVDRVDGCNGVLGQRITWSGVNDGRCSRSRRRVREIG
jgi:hypothetical protein